MIQQIACAEPYTESLFGEGVIELQIEKALGGNITVHQE